MEDGRWKMEEAEGCVENAAYKKRKREEDRRREEDGRWMKDGERREGG